MLPLEIRILWERQEEVAATAVVVEDLPKSWRTLAASPVPLEEEELLDPLICSTQPSTNVNAGCVVKRGEPIS